MNVTLTLFGQMFTFLVLVWFVMRYMWEPITRALADRQARIADGLAAAERGQQERELAEQKAAEMLREAREQAQEIVSHARRRGDEIIEESKQAAREEGERLLAAARSDIEQEMTQAREALRSEVSRLALLGAERLLRREVDPKAHSDLLAELAEQL